MSAAGHHFQIIHSGAAHRLLVKNETAAKLGNTDNDVINSELSPYQWQDIKVQQGITPNIKTNGIQIFEYHQIEKISGNSITFKEPIMHAINKDWGL